ncbi:MAG: UDP-N-acetylmuramoyl-L-alanine--D-glutamate ligase [Lentisphaeria bacterium]|nr:UDP-N-acetylmuramoyl-L-alanine--D-glutamate ligase [Lentisphaeria bacterium]
MKERILVCGLGVSGEGAALLALKLGRSVVIVDEKDNASLREKGKRFSAMGAELLLGWKKGTFLPDCDIIVLSPGIRRESALYNALPEKAEKMSELSFALRHIPCPFAAVTGTNGKTTVTELSSALFCAAGRRSLPAGNVGDSLSNCVVSALEGKCDFLMIEVSSFQLETMKTFPACPGALLNIGSDHIDRHGSLEEYAKIKFSLLKAPRRREERIVNGNVLPFLHKFLPGEEATLFSSSDPSADFFADGEQKKIFYRGKEFFDFREAKLKGVHNMENVCASLALLRGALGEEALFLPAVRTALKEFSPSPHRMEVFLEKGGVKYVDDSKATNPHAVNAAVARFAEESGGRKNLILLLGGLDKAMDFSELEKSLVYVKKVILTGSCAENIGSFLAGKVEMENCGRNFPLAVEKACSSASEGDIVLLSPATASMDMFENYAQRGDSFKALVKEFAERTLPSPSPGKP